nr:MAG TPA: hypothetical protein [Caudoviricetes sp.]
MLCAKLSNISFFVSITSHPVEKANILAIFHYFYMKNMIF